MRLAKFRKLLGRFFFLVTFFSVFFLNSHDVFAGGGGGGGTGGGGSGPGVPPGIPGGIAGRFFNDANGNGTREDSEEWMYNGGSGCSLYGGAKMELLGLSVSISGTSYAPDICNSASDGTVYPPIYQTPRIFYIAGDIAVTAQLPSGWICSPGSSSICPSQTVHRNGGDISTPAADIGIQRNSIGVSLSVDPPPEPLISETKRKLKADVVGSITASPVIYTFWWNCSNSSASVSAATTACGDPNNSLVGVVKTQNSTSLTPSFTTANHTYSPGTYTGKVIVQRGTAAPVESRVTFTILPPAPTTGYIIGRVFNDKDGDGSYDGGDALIQDDGVGCTSGSISIETLSGIKIEPTSGQTFFSVSPRACNSEGPYYNSGAVELGPNGTYTVRITVPPGWVLTTPGSLQVTVTAGGLGTVNGTNPAQHPWFGIRQESFISGVVFLDNDGNGYPDSGEHTLVSKNGCPGYSDQIILPGAVVSGAGETSFSTEPDKCLSGSGMPYYVSPDVKPGTYELSLAAPAGWKSTTGSKTVRVGAGDNFAAIDGSWLWFGVQPLGTPQGDHQGRSGTNVDSLSCNVEGWAGDPDYPAGDINIRIKKDGVVIAGPILANQLTEPPADRPIADSWWVGNGCAGNVGDQVSCYFGKTSPISIYSEMSDGFPHSILVEAQDVNSSGIPTGAWVPLAVGLKEIQPGVWVPDAKSPKLLQCKPPGKVQIDRIKSDGTFITTGTLANVDAAVSGTCAEGTVCSSNPSFFSGVDPSGHGANATDLAAYTETVGTCIYDFGAGECSVSVSGFSSPAGGCDGTNCNHGIAVTEGKVIKVVYKYTPILPDLITNHQPITIIGTLTTGSSLTFKSTVKNQGAGSAGAGSVGRWCRGGTEAQCAGSTDPASQLNLSTAFGMFAAGDVSLERTSNPWTATLGTHTIWWCADVKNSITESDENNNCTSQSFTISAPPNNAPDADAGLDQAVSKNDTVNLSGSGSSDPDGDTLTYTWSFTSRPSGSTATFSNSNSVAPSFTADKTGTYDVHLMVSDGALSDSDEMQVEVTNTPPSNFSLSCTDVVGLPDADPPCDVVVQFSPALKAKSTPAIITITGASAPVTFDVINVFAGYPIVGSPPPVSIQGFAEVFNNVVQDSFTTSDTSFEFKVQVSKLAANPTNKLTYTVRLRASSGGHEEVIDLRLTLKASRSGTGEE